MSDKTHIILRLNIYQLQTTSPPVASSSPPSITPASSGNGGDGKNFLSKFFLQPIIGCCYSTGLANSVKAYHTSITVGNMYTYTFGANVGVVKEITCTAASVPLHFHRPSTNTTSITFQESLILDTTDTKSAAEEENFVAVLPVHVIIEIIKILQDTYFTKTAYHLLHRNCNHFTQTVYTAIAIAQIKFNNVDDFTDSTADTTTTATSFEGIYVAKQQKKHIVNSNTYPNYINRLAATGAALLSKHDDDIIPCSIWDEAMHAVATATATSNTTVKKQPRNKNSKQKKNLTEKQKLMLQKISKK